VLVSFAIVARLNTDAYVVFSAQATGPDSEISSHTTQALSNTHLPDDRLKQDDRQVVKDDAIR